MVPANVSSGNLAAMEAGTETLKSAKCTRLEICSSSSLGTVANLYRIPRFNVKEGLSCQLS